MCRKGYFMNLRKAQKLLQEDYTKLSIEELQKFKVSIIDAWRYARGDYGKNNDFFVYVGELKAYVPKDYWLLKNIESIMDNLGI